MTILDLIMTKQFLLSKFLTLSFSSNFNVFKRGTSADSGLSLLVGDPPRTYSTILTPNPPVESRGL